MNDWDQMIARQTERDGVRTMSGHHIRTPGHDDVRRGRTGDTRCGVHDPDDYCDYCQDDPPDHDPWIDRRDDDR